MKNKVAMGFLIIGLMAGTFANAGGFYLSGGIDYQWTHKPPAPVDIWMQVPFKAADGSTRYTLEPRTLYPNWSHDITKIKNPGGTAVVGFDWDWKYVTIDIEFLRHRSMNVHDRGTNTSGVYFKVYPFGR